MTLPLLDGDSRYDTGGSEKRFPPQGDEILVPLSFVPILSIVVIPTLDTSGVERVRLKYGLLQVTFTVNEMYDLTFYLLNTQNMSP